MPLRALRAGDADGSITPPELVLERRRLWKWTTIRPRGARQ
jgi:hypothetical protein